ncbi:hypothetical protein AB0L17_37535, partial [Streptomyces cellulosae]
LFLMDYAGLPLKTVLEQLDILGEEVVPVLRKEFAVVRGVRGLGIRRRRVHRGSARAHTAGGRRAGRPDGRPRGGAGVGGGRHHRARTAAIRPAVPLRPTLAGHTTPRAGA